MGPVWALVVCAFYFFLAVGARAVGRQVVYYLADKLIDHQWLIICLIVNRKGIKLPRESPSF